MYYTTSTLLTCTKRSRDTLFTTTKHYIQHKSHHNILLTIHTTSSAIHETLTYTYFDPIISNTALH